MMALLDHWRTANANKLYSNAVIKTNQKTLLYSRYLENEKQEKLEQAALNHEIRILKALCNDNRIRQGLAPIKI